MLISGKTREIGKSFIGIIIYYITKPQMTRAKFKSLEVGASLILTWQQKLSTKAKHLKETIIILLRPHF